MPELEAAIAGRDDAALVTVVFAARPRQVRNVVLGLGFGAPVLFDRPLGPGHKPLHTRYGVSQVPWTLVVDERGRGAEVIVGGHDRARFRKAMNALD